MIGLPLGQLNRIGDLLCETKLLSREQLDAALHEQQITHEMPGGILVKRGFATEEAVARAVSSQLSIPFIEEPASMAKPAAVKFIPQSLALRKGSSRPRCPRWTPGLFGLTAWTRSSRE